MPVYNARWVELWSGLTAVAWAVYIGGMSIALADLPAWAAVARWGSNSEVAFAAGVAGVVQAFSARFGSHILRFCASSLMFVLCVILADGIWIAAFASPGLVLYVGWALANLVSVMRVLRRRR